MLDRNQNPQGPVGDREGFALVTTLLLVLVLAVLALGVAWLASTEKKTSFAEQVHVTSVFAADAGGEMGINFIRVADNPPQIVDMTDNSVNSTGDVTLHGSQKYQYNCQYQQRRVKPGWGVDYLDYDYAIQSRGEASVKGQTNIQVVVSRLFKEGY